ncbi:MAG: hypothetical protein H0V82_07985 [Candidatus Protochlamydia sp.]|nr:hypothetical protein [Candidatus Protochlamydia sp.]
MKSIKLGFYFLGSIYFAIALIALTAFLVIVATFLEASADSHLFAAEWIYHHAFFSVLLSFFFINILFSALRRWPFKSRHLPFLITHLGLLMIIGGTLIKQRSGIQGNLNVWEGSGSQTLTIPHTYSLQIENKATGYNYPIKLQKGKIDSSSTFSALKIKVLGSYANVSEEWETWIKGEGIFLTGLPPLPVQNWDISEPFPQGIFTPFLSRNWLLLALRTSQLEASIRNFYVEELTLRLGFANDSNKAYEIPLKKALREDILFNGYKIRTQLQLTFSPTDGFLKPLLTLCHDVKGGMEKKIWVDLQGSHSLYVQTDTGSNLFSVDLVRPAPALLIAEDENNDQFVFAFDQYGRVHAEVYRKGHLGSLIVYDEGFSGYAIQARLPLPTYPTSRLDKEKGDHYFLTQQLKQALQKDATLAPPLNLFKEACKRSHLDCAEHLANFLKAWDQGKTLLFLPSSLDSSLKTILTELNWEEVPVHDKKACHWVSKLFEQFYDLPPETDYLLFLKEKQWPFLNDLKVSLQEKSPTDLFTQLARQIFYIVRELPPLIESTPLGPARQATLLSAYLKAYEIEYSTLLTKAEPGEEKFERVHSYQKPSEVTEEDYLKETFIVLETPLTIRHHSKQPLTKKEDNRPGLLIEVQEGNQKQIIALSYDATAMGLKWPVLNGRYLVRFQPEQLELPYRLRLRQARQINYPHTEQPYSYEADLLISEKNQNPIERTLSMNHVYETWDGYRFYLAGMNGSSEQTSKRVQIIVNRDPIKYFLTYPGALLVTLGTFLLFWLMPRTKRENK